MITLYVKTGCPFCAKALAAVEALNIEVEQKNIAEEAVVEELIERGGKRMVPYLVDGETEMYESDDIVAYLQKIYGSSDNTEGDAVHTSETSPVSPNDD